MILVNYDSFTAASTLIHSSQGAALLLLGGVEAYSLYHPENQLKLAGPLALLAAALAMPLAALALPGGWSLEGLKYALEARRGFYVFMAFACLFGAAGLSRLTQLALDRRDGGWQALFLLFLGGCSALYFVLPWRVNEEAWRQTLPWHAAIGFTLLLAVALKTVHVFTGRRKLQLAWAALLVLTAAQLLTYRETEGAFGLRMVTIETAPELPPAKTAAIPRPKNVPTLNKKLPAR
jgi:hypothetical protein